MPDNYCCPICYRPGIESTKILIGCGERKYKKEEVILLQQRFFKMLKRYSRDLDRMYGHGDGVGDDINKTDFPVLIPLEKLNELNLICCEDCSKIMGNFCDLYHKMKTNELLLNWKVMTLNNIMKSAQGVPTRIKYLKECIRKSNRGESRGRVDDVMASVVRTKKSLIKKCSLKAKNGFPRLSIPEYHVDIVKLTDTLPVHQPIQIGPALPSVDNICTGSDHPASVSILNVCDNSDSDPYMDEIRMEAIPGVNDSGTIISELSQNGSAFSAKATDTETESNQNMMMPLGVGVEEGLFVLPSVIAGGDDDADESRHPQEDNQGDTEVVGETGRGDFMQEEASPNGALSSTEDEDEKPTENFTRLPSQLASNVAVEDTVPSSNPGSATLINNPANEMGSRHQELKRLRPTHKCKHCGKTFSLLERLQQHVKDCAEAIGNENDASSQPSSSSSSENEAVDESDADSMCWSTSSDDDLKSSSDSPLDNPPQGNFSPPQFARNAFGKNYNARNPPFRLKCPDCNRLFEDCKAILLHRKNSECPSVSSSSYDSTAIIKVQVLIPPTIRPSGTRPEYTDLCATIDLPLEIYSCGICNVTVYSSEDLEIHKKLHGVFPCEFCDVTVSYAPDLSYHELEYHANKSTSALFCTRCDFKCLSTQRNNSYVQHHLQNHLSLNWTHPLCPICKITHNKSLTKGKLAAHFKKCHDLSSPQDIIGCSVANCKAYFLSALHLHQHLRRHHNIMSRASYYNRQVLKCVDCDRAFADRGWLRNHRLRHHLPAPAQRFPCTVPRCHKDFLTRVDLKRHLRKAVTFHRNIQQSTVKRERSKCPKCNKKIINLKQHMAFHAMMVTKEAGLLKLFPCGLCKRQKLFSCRMKLERHLANHKKEKPFVCQICQQRFSCRGQLGTHMKRKHPGDQGDTMAEKCLPGTSASMQEVMLSNASEDKSAPDESSETTEMKPRINKKSNYLSKPKPFEKWEKNAPFRLKCPDCRNLFKDVRTYLLHRRDSESCGVPYNPSAKVLTQILTVQDSAQTPKIDNGIDESDFTNIYATINIPQEIFACDSCDITVYSPEDMDAHQELHGTFPCKFCAVEFTYAPSLSLHELQHVQQNSGGGDNDNKSSLHCPRCQFKCHQSYQVKYIHHHLESHLSLTLNDPFCPICKTTTRFDQHVPLHFKTHHDLTNLASTSSEDIKRCSVENCDAYFLNGHQLFGHQSIRHRTLTFGKIRWKPKRRRKCKDCDKDYKDATNLRRHRIRHHPAEPAKLVPCSVAKCPRLFESMEDMERHVRYAKPYHKSLQRPPGKKQITYVQCPKCNKQVDGSRPVNMRTHMRSHEYEEKVQAGLIKRKGPQPEICEICGKVFKDKHYLKVHYLAHSGPESWEYVCEVCSKKCSSKWKLKEHMLRHTNEKPHVCQFCGQKYGHRHNLRIHVNNKHGDVAQDIPRKCDKTNPTSRKGIKRKRIEQERESSTGSDSD